MTSLAVCFAMAALPGVALVTVTASAQSRLPPCSPSLKGQPGLYKPRPFSRPRWKDCFGTQNYSYGEKYVGEFHNGKRHGYGTYTHSDGSKYVGEFRDGMAHGQGTFTDADGSKYVGEFRDNHSNGQGTFNYADGSKYIGEVVDGKRHGRGTYTDLSGRDYYGEWRENHFYEDLQSATSGPEEVRLISEGGTFKVPAVINGAMMLHFTVDSGASVVVLPPHIVLSLRHTGTLRESDFLGPSTVTLADGSQVKFEMFRIGRLQVGDRVVEDVMGAIAPQIDSEPLLGQSFLNRFNSWSMNYQRQTLILE